MVTLEAGSWRSLLPSWTTRSPGHGIAALSDVKRICASSCLQRQLVCSGSREVAAAGLWQQPVERRVGQEGKVGAAKRVPYARVSTCHYSQHSGLRSGSGSKIRIKIRIKQEPGLRKNNQEPCMPLNHCYTSIDAALIAAIV